MQTKEALKNRGLRATPHRMAILSSLATANSPKTAEELHARLGNLDLVTVYRNLQNLVSAELVKEVRFKDSSVRYELGGDGAHHHHLVCSHCGKVDELEGCDMGALEKQVLNKSTRFASVDEHALEFFGTCVSCIKR